MVDTDVSDRCGHWPFLIGTDAAAQGLTRPPSLALLVGLKGVRVPMASAILTLIDPRRYGVIDIRVWQLLYAIKSVQQLPGGRGSNSGTGTTAWPSFAIMPRN